MSIASELRAAIQAEGFVIDGPIGVRSEAIRIEGLPVKQHWIRAMFAIGGVEWDVHTPRDDFPSATRVARGLRWVVDHPEKHVLNGSRQMVIDRIRENRGAADEPPVEIVSLP